MSNINEEKSIQEKVTVAIKEGKLVMKPKWHFILKTVMHILVAVILFFVLIYLISFIGLVAREKELFKLLHLNPRELYLLTTSIPWIIVILSLFLLLVFYTLVKDYSFIYKKPLVYSLSGTIFFVILIGALIQIFDVNFRFARFGEGPRVPLLGPMHKYYRGDMEHRPMMKYRGDMRLMPPPKFEAQFLK